MLNFNTKQMDKMTNRLHQKLKELPVLIFKQVPECFFSINHGTPSRMRYNEIFGNRSDKNLLDCSAKEVAALSELSGIPCSELMFEYGMGIERMSGSEINALLKKEGMELAPVVHAA